ncbi:O-antigen ligase family protein [Nitrospinota bacterium]
MEFKNSDLTAKICNFFIRWGLVFLLGFTPLSFGAVQPWAYTVMEVVVILLTVAWFFRMIWEREFRFPKLAFLVPVAFFVGLLLFQLIPISPRTLAFVSPATHELYGWTAPNYSDENPGGKPIKATDSNRNTRFSISVYPHATYTGLIKFLSYLGVFFIVVSNFHTRRDVRFVLIALILFGFAFSVFAVVQKFSWNGMMYWFIHLKPNRHHVFGPYINRNHFAGYVEMIIPLAIGLGLGGRSGFQSFKESLRNRGNIRIWAMSRITNSFNQNIILLFMGIFMAGVLFISLSRGGMISFLGSMAVFVLMVKWKNNRGVDHRIIGAILVLVLLFAGWMGFDLVSERTMESFGEPDKFNLLLTRLRVWGDTLPIIWEFPLFGTGLATYGAIFTLYQTPHTQLRFLDAHNDYLQLFAETGIFGGVIFFAAAVFFLFHVFKRFRDLRDGRMIALSQAGFASVSALAFHSFVDFNLRIPANALHFSLILGLLVVMVNLRGGERSQRYTLPVFRFPLAGPRAVWAVLVLFLGSILTYAVISTREARDSLHSKEGKKVMYRMRLISKINPERAIVHGKNALREFNRAISLNPLNYIYHYRLGLTAAFLRRKVKHTALKADRTLVANERSLRKATRLFPSSAQVHYHASMYYFLNWKSSSPSERRFAFEAMKKALAIHPPFKHGAQSRLQRKWGKNLDPDVKKFIDAYFEKKR